MMNTAKPHWLFASGNAERLEVLQSPMTRSTGDVGRFIRDNGLVLSAREIFQHEHFMWGEAHASVYVQPAARNAGGVDFIVSLQAGFAGAYPEHLETTALAHVREQWPFPADADDYDDDDDDDEPDPWTN